MTVASSRLEQAALWVACACAVAPLISIAASHILLGASLVLLVAMRVKPVWTPAWPPLVVFMVWSVFSLLLSGDARGGLPQVRKFYVLIALVVFASLIRELARIRTVTMGWAAAAAASSVWSGVQFYRKWASLSPGEDFYLAYVANRVTGFMSHWMTFSGVVMAALLFVAARVLFAKESLRTRWLLACACALMAFGLALSWTRSVWFGCFCGLLYLAWNWRKASVLALPVAMAAGLMAAPDSLRERALSVLRPHGERDSNLHRTVTRAIGWQMIRAHPWFGVGPEQVGKQHIAYLPAGTTSLPDGFYGHLHNIYFHFAAERGIPALLALLCAVVGSAVAFCCALRRKPPPEERAILHGAVAVTIAILVTGFFEHNLGDSEVLQIYLATVAFGFTAARSVPPAQFKAAAS